MKDNKSRLIEAAIKTFSQYGVKKTSMADIADCAGVSRQTVYVNFKNKDEMLAAAMNSVVNDIEDDLRVQWSNTDSIEDKLIAYFDVAVIGIYDRFQTLPDARDLILGVGMLSMCVAQDANKKKARILAEQLQPHAEQLKVAGTDPKSVAQFIVSTAGNMKYTVATRQELETLLHTLKQSVLAMIGTNPSR